MTAAPRVPRGEISPWRSALAEARRRIGSLMALGVISRTISSSLLAPAFSAVVTGVISRKGRASFGNTEIVGFLFTPTGMFLVLVSGTLLHVSQIVEVAALMILGRGGLDGRVMPVFGALWGTARALPRLFALALGLWVALLVLAVPFGAIVGAAYLAMWSGSDLYFLVRSRPPAFWAGAAVAAAAAAGYAIAAGVLLVRWAFSIPILLFEGRSVASALRASARETRGSRWRIARLGAAWLLLPLAADALALGVLRSVGGLALDAVGPSMIGVLLVASILLALQAMAVATIAFAANAIGTFWLLGLRGGHGDAAVPSEIPRRIGPRAALLGGIVAVSAVATIGPLGVISAMRTDDPIDITAHRGASKEAPENSVSAFSKAIDAGADFGELDVQLTRDGQVVVAHDRDLMRQFGNPLRIRDATLSELKKFDLGATFSPAFRGERIATLEEVIDAVSGRLRLMIEIKVYADDDVPRLVSRTVDLVRRKGIASSCAILSLDYGVLNEVRRLDPTIRTSYVVGQSLGDLTRLDVDILNVRSPLATPALIAAADHHSLPVHAWTVSDPGAMMRLWTRGVSNVLTNDPRPLVARRAEVLGLSASARWLLRVRYLLTD